MLLDAPFSRSTRRKPRRLRQSSISNCSYSIAEHGTPHSAPSATIPTPAAAPLQAPASSRLAASPDPPVLKGRIRVVLSGSSGGNVHYIPQKLVDRGGDQFFGCYNSVNFSANSLIVTLEPSLHGSYLVRITKRGLEPKFRPFSWPFATGNSSWDQLPRNRVVEE